jgi:LytS/YehU family sensor histidine kinase
MLNQLMIYCAVLAAGFAREYFLREQRRGREAAELEAQLARARLDALRMQLNPHFLFNTLHAVSALVERDPAGVRKMIARLSELLRHTLDSRTSDEVPLREELAFLQRYFDIMAVRFQGRLRVSTSVDDDASNARAELHPAAARGECARAWRQSNRRCRDRDPRAPRGSSTRDLDPRSRPGFDASAESGVGLAMKRARLAALYGDAASVAIRTAPEGGAAAELRLPWRDA